MCPNRNERRYEEEQSYKKHEGMEDLESRTNIGREIMLTVTGTKTKQ